MAIEVSDILFDNDDVVFFDGDLKVDLSDTQHVRDIFKLDLGQSRQFPLLGIGVYREKKGNTNKVLFKQRVRRMLNYDNYSVLNVSVNDQFQTTVYAERLK